MSGVGVSGLLANLPGTITPYPTQDPNLEKGGFRNDVATVADMNAIPANFRTEGMQVYVRNTKCIYALLPDLTTFKILANVNLGAQAAWFINLGNSTGLASDSNDGLTALTPLLTWAEFQNRCFPNGARLNVKQNVAITIIAATAQSLGNAYMNWGEDPSVNVAPIITLVGAITSSAAITLNAVTKADAATNVRAQFATAAGTFVNQERIRVTSGAALGAVCYSMGLVSPTNTYVGNPGIDELTTMAYPVSGDQVVVDTLLVQINRLEIVCGAQMRVRVSDLKITRAYLFAYDLNPYTGSGSGIFMLGCVATSTGGQWVAPWGANYINCRVPATGKTSFSGNAVLFVNHNVQGVMGFGWGSMVVYGIWVSAGNVIFGVTDNYNHVGMSASPKVYLANPQISALSAGSVQCENGPGPMGATYPALMFAPGAIVQNDSFQSEMWGVSGGYPVAFQFVPLSWLWFSADPVQSAPLTYMKIAATVAMRVCGTDLAYSANPDVFKSLGGGVVNAPQPNLSQTEGYVTRTALVAAVGSTAILAANVARKALFKVSGYLAPTVAGAAGTLTLNAIYTDDSGATITTPVCSINNTVLAGAGGSVEIQCNGTSTISYSVTGYSAGLTYNVRVTAQIDSAGP